MTTALVMKQFLVPSNIAGWEGYLAKVNAIPLLSQEEEFSLADRFQREGDLLSAEKLVLSHLRYVVRVAKGYMGYGLQLPDLVQEGTIGLMKAVKRFDPHMGVRLVSFAVHWIKSEIHEYIIRNWRIVKIATTKAQRKLFFNLRSMKKRLGWFNVEEIKAVAHDLGVKESDVREMEIRLNAIDPQYDAPLDEVPVVKGEVYTLSPSDYLEATPESTPFVALASGEFHDIEVRKLHQAISTLDNREQQIIQSRYFEEQKTTLKILAEQMDVSIERVRQLEKQAVQKLREALALMR